MLIQQKQYKSGSSLRRRQIREDKWSKLPVSIRRWMFDVGQFRITPTRPYSFTPQLPSPQPKAFLRSPLSQTFPRVRLLSDRFPPPFIIEIPLNRTTNA